jgi:hypothetical protein
MGLAAVLVVVDFGGAGAVVGVGAGAGAAVVLVVEPKVAVEVGDSSITAGSAFSVATPA